MTNSKITPETQKRLLGLAAVLHDHATTGLAPKIVVFVGAGASKSAGLPLGSVLAERLRGAFVKDGSNQVLQDELAWEGRKRFGGGTPLEVLHRLSLFEFAALLGRMESGRRVIGKTIDALRNEWTRRPLAYEILSHLAKHGFIDHFVSLNFDPLLDDSLADELPDRLIVMTNPEDSPSDELVSGRKRPCFLIRPFGRLGTGRYYVTESDVEKFSDSVLRVLEERVFASDQHVRPRETKLVFLLIGYAAAEPAFEKLVKSRIHEGYPIELYWIDTAPKIPAQLSALGVPVTHIRLPADDALEILIGILKHLSDDSKRIWVPAARHELMSKCFQHLAFEPTLRLRLEILLQAVKSRGFVHLEVLEQIPRLNRYAGVDALEVLESLLKEGVLVPDLWNPNAPEDAKLYTRYVPNLMLIATDAAARKIDETCGVDQSLTQWEVTRTPNDRNSRVREDFNWKIENRSVSRIRYISGRLKTIEDAPEIEIVAGPALDAKWVLGDPTEIRSIDELTRETRDLLLRADKFSGEIFISGIWATGEWLFNEDGWGFDLGEMLLARVRRRTAKLDIVISRAGGVRGLRTMRRAQVVRKLNTVRVEFPDKLEIGWRDWWDMNRVLTLVRFGAEISAIYFRRRLAQPMVSPVVVHLRPGITYLEEMFSHYKRRATPITTSDVSSLPNGRP